MGRSVKKMKLDSRIDLKAESDKWCPNCRIIFDALFGDHTHLGSDVTIKEAHEKFPCTTPQEGYKQVSEMNLPSLEEMRRNAVIMVKRFVVITDGFNQRLRDLMDYYETGEPLQGLAIQALGSLGIRSITIDNPERYEIDAEGHRKNPDSLQFQAIHPEDIERVVARMKEIRIQ